MTRPTAAVVHQNFARRLSEAVMNLRLASPPVISAAGGSSLGVKSLSTQKRSGR